MILFVLVLFNIMVAVPSSFLYYFFWVVFTLLFLFFLGLLLQTKIFRSFFYFLLVWEAMLFSFDCLYFVTIITLFKVTPSEDDFF